MKDGLIDLGTPRADELGFTSELFDGYLWKHGNNIIISFIDSKHPGKGNLKRLFDGIEAKGFAIAVPTPSRRMHAICLKRGMALWTDPQDGCEYMRKPL